MVPLRTDGEQVAPGGMSLSAKVKSPRYPLRVIAQAEHRLLDFVVTHTAVEEPHEGGCFFLKVGTIRKANSRDSPVEQVMVFKLVELGDVGGPRSAPPHLVVLLILLSLAETY